MERIADILFEYFKQNFSTLLIMSATLALMFANRKNKISATDLFSVGLLLLLVITASDTLSEWCGSNSGVRPSWLHAGAKLRLYSSAVTYILRPFIILVEVFIVAPPKLRMKKLLLIPALLNTAAYSTAFFGSGLAFGYGTGGGFYRGPLGYSVYISQLFYVALLLWFSLLRFRGSDLRKSIILLLICVQVMVSALLEYSNLLSGTTNVVTALAVLEYYIYLSVIYQQEMRDAIAQRDLNLEKDKMLILRNQIHPHFIYNSLSIIRSLAKHDSVQAVSCIDSFSDYLKAHIGAIETDSLITFEKELYNIRAYLDLARADKSRKIDVFYELETTDFRIPPLSLEPLIENAVNHGLSRDGGIIRIVTEETPESYVIRVSDNGTAKHSPENDKPFHMGVGIENTRKRLAMHCNGTLDLDMTDHGTTVTVIIPKEVKANESSGS